ncbi:uncharacterized protein LOC131212114 [Anopheles bellator]|uniref:uncharacterized protein LOC131212114 n=1 Tax=Anopheles bellator TaxID=139047 RepID=UPI00264761CA|nr:uncharacterized protein LOC131212114 [Anopheles bellator]
MARTYILGTLLGVVLLAVFAQSAPQYAPGEEPTYDEDDQASDLAKEDNDASGNEEDYAAIEAGLNQPFGTAADPGRRLGDGQRLENNPLHLQ